ncbi:MAG: Nif3-like dinuclear metal center hexameric protein, partial [Oscillospiraceae bacterium]
FIEVTRCLITLDVTQNVCDEAAGCGADLILSHHPVIFDPIKRISSQSTIYQLISEGISVISAHTNLDKSKNGVNDVLICRLGVKSAVPVGDTNDGLKIGSLGTMMTGVELAHHVKERLWASSVRLFDAGFPIETVAICSGSGGSFLKDAVKAGADALITGDVKHDVVVEAANCGMTVIDAGHYETEQIIIEPLIEYLTPLFPDVEFMRAQSCKPFFTVV